NLPWAHFSTADRVQISADMIGPRAMKSTAKGILPEGHRARTPRVVMNTKKCKTKPISRLLSTHVDSARPDFSIPRHLNSPSPDRAFRTIRPWEAGDLDFRSGG